MNCFNQSRRGRGSRKFKLNRGRTPQNLNPSAESIRGLTNRGGSRGSRGGRGGHGVNSTIAGNNLEFNETFPKPLSPNIIILNEQPPRMSTRLSYAAATKEGTPTTSQSSVLVAASKTSTFTSTTVTTGSSKSSTPTTRSIPTITITTTTATPPVTTRAYTTPSTSTAAIALLPSASTTSTTAITGNITTVTSSNFYLRPIMTPVTSVETFNSASNNIQQASNTSASYNLAAQQKILQLQKQNKKMQKNVKKLLKKQKRSTDSQPTAAMSTTHKPQQALALPHLTLQSLPFSQPFAANQIVLPPPQFIPPLYPGTPVQPYLTHPQFLQQQSAALINPATHQVLSALQVLQNSFPTYKLQLNLN